jgi:hypothetical protein
VVTTDQEMISCLRHAAEGTITQSGFYERFGPWKAETKSPLSELIFEEVEHFWANLRLPKAPKNILANDRERMRVLAKALQGGWDAVRTETEVDNW